MMIPLLICSFLVLLITLERVFVLRRQRLVADEHFQEWQRWFTETAAGPSSTPDNNSAVITRILSPLIGLLPLPRSRFEERLTDLARLQRHRLERGLVWLETIAGVAPLFGLLGTVLGMVEVFSRLSVVGEAKMSALSSGISQALFSTVAGLFIGIPALVAYNLFSRHIDNLMFAVEEQINGLIDRFHSQMIQSGPLGNRDENR